MQVRASARPVVEAPAHSGLPIERRCSSAVKRAHILRPASVPRALYQLGSLLSHIVKVACRCCFTGLVQGAQSNASPHPPPPPLHPARPNRACQRPSASPEMQDLNHFQQYLVSLGPHTVGEIISPLGLLWLLSLSASSTALALGGIFGFRALWTVMEDRIMPETSQVDGGYPSEQCRVLCAWGALVGTPERVLRVPGSLPGLRCGWSQTVLGAAMCR